MQNLKQDKDRYRFQLGADPAAVGQKTDVIHVDVYYSKGGMNTFSGRGEKRGIRLSITPVRQEGREPFSFEPPDSVGVVSVVTLGKGVRFLVKETARKNDKELARVAEALDSFVPLYADFYLKGESNNWLIADSIKSVMAQTGLVEAGV